MIALFGAETKIPSYVRTTGCNLLDFRLSNAYFCLGRYLRGEIAREEAVEAAGMDWVKLAERQHKAMMEDLAWALRE